MSGIGDTAVLTPVNRAGFVIHGYLGGRTLFTKSVGLALSVASGLSLGTRTLSVVVVPDLIFPLARRQGGTLCTYRVLRRQHRQQVLQQVRD